MGSRPQAQRIGRPLPEGTILICQRAGIKRFVLEVPQKVQGEIVGSLSRFSHYGSIAIVESLSTFFAGHAQSEICTPGLLISGNLVFSGLHVAPRPTCLVQKASSAAS